MVFASKDSLKQSRPLEPLYKVIKYNLCFSMKSFEDVLGREALVGEFVTTLNYIDDIAGGKTPDV